MCKPRIVLFGTEMRLFSTWALCVRRPLFEMSRGEALLLLPPPRQAEAEITYSFFPAAAFSSNTRGAAEAEAACY